MKRKPSNELRKILFELQSPDERERISTAETLETLEKFDKLYSELEEAFDERDLEYSEALDLLIADTDKKIKSYLDSVVKDTDSKIDKINSLVNEVETKSGSIEVDLRSQIKGAKQELTEFSNKVLALHSSSKEETVNTIKDVITDSKKAVKDLEERTDKILSEIETVKKDLLSRMSTMTGGGSMNQKISVNGTVMSKNYADINLTGSGITATNNNTTKQVDIDLSGLVGGSSLADVSADSTTTPLSLYTMTPSIPVEFRSSDGNKILLLSETNEQISIGAGTAALPSLSIGTNASNGIWADNPNQVTIAANGTEAARFLVGASAVPGGGGKISNPGNTAHIGWNTVGDIGLTSNTDKTIFLTSGGPITLTAGGTNQNITLTPSGTGGVITQLGASRVIASQQYASQGTLHIVGVATTPTSSNFILSGDGSANQFNANNNIQLTIGGSAKVIIPSSGNMLVGGLGVDGTGVLQFPAATTSAGGITFGTDTNYFRRQSGYMNHNVTSGTDVGMVFQLIGVDKLSIQHTSGRGELNAVGNLLFYTNGAPGTLALTLDTSQNATFAGNVTLPTSGFLYFGGTGSSITGSSGGQTMQINMGNGNNITYFTNTAVLIGGDSVLDSGPLQVARHSIAVTSTDAATLFNRTAATSGVTVQMSPRLRLRGSAWNTSATKNVDWWIENLPKTLATPGAYLKFGYQLEGAAVIYPVTFGRGADGANYSNVQIFSTTGNADFGIDGVNAYLWNNSGGGFLSLNGGSGGTIVLASGESTMGNAFRLNVNGIAAVSTNGFSITNGTNATALVPVEMSPRLRLAGSAWNSSGGGSAEADSWIIENLPATVAGTTTSVLRFGSSINAGAYTYLTTITSGGNVLVGGLTTNGTGVLQFPTATTSAGGITFGTDTLLYRNAANEITLGSTSANAVAMYLNTNGTNRAWFEVAGTTTTRLVSITGTLEFRSNNTLALTLDTSQNATFAGEGNFVNNVTIVRNGIGTTAANGLGMVNATSAAAGAQQYSPSFEQAGRGWKTDATAASQIAGFRRTVRPVQGAANPSVNLVWESSINGTYADKMTLTSAGALTILDNFSAVNGTFSGDIQVGATKQLYWGGGRATMSSSADAYFKFGNSNHTVGGLLDVATADTFKFQNFANTAGATIQAAKSVQAPSANNRMTSNRILYGATTDAATAVELTTDGAAGSGATNRISVPTDTAMSVVLNICVKQAGSANAKQMLRQFILSNNAGTTAIQGSVTTLGTDVGSAGLTTVTTTITANDTDDCIKVEVNGVIATNLRYTAYLVSTETLYA